VQLGVPPSPVVEILKRDKTSANLDRLPGKKSKARRHYLHVVFCREAIPSESDIVMKNQVYLGGSLSSVSGDSTVRDD
jgi:hypothetical protein